VPPVPYWINAVQKEGKRERKESASQKKGKCERCGAGCDHWLIEPSHGRLDDVMSVIMVGHFDLTPDQGIGVP